MAIAESGENYLETILLLEREKNTVRAIDVSEKLNFSRASVSRALGILRSEGLIEVDPNGAVTLTKQGRGIAETIYERHTLLTQLLISWGVDPSVAAGDACRIEHVISDETIAAIKSKIH